MGGCFPKYQRLSNTSSSDRSKIETEKELIIDHVQFLVYCNKPYLKKIHKQLDSKIFGVSEYPDSEENSVYFNFANLGLHVISSSADRGYDKNAICVVLDKKNWPHCQEPYIAEKDLMKPSIHSSLLFVTPSYPSLFKTDEKSPNSAILCISEQMAKMLLALPGGPWRLPSFVHVKKSLFHIYDMALFVNGKLVVPTWQCNTPISDLDLSFLL